MAFPKPYEYRYRFAPQKVNYMLIVSLAHSAYGLARNAPHVKCWAYIT